MSRGLMARCAKLPWQLHLKRLICTCRLLHHYSTSFRYYFSCFTFLSLLLCIPREWDANLHVSIATMGRCSFKVMHPLDARPVYRFPTSFYRPHIMSWRFLCLIYWPGCVAISRNLAKYGYELNFCFRT